jgi:hypothetical protein
MEEEKLESIRRAPPEKSVLPHAEDQIEGHQIRYVAMP